MNIKQKLGKIILERSESYQFYSQQHDTLIENEEKKSDIIKQLKKASAYKSQQIKIINSEHKQQLNHKNKQIQKLENANNQLEKEITMDTNLHDDKIRKINIKHKKELNDKNNQIQKLQATNKELTEKIINNKDDFKQIKSKISSNEKSTKKLLSLLKNNDETEKLDYLEKNINYLNIKLDEKFDENERFITSNMNDIGKKINDYLISIIIPTYNVEKYLERCFLSILHQTIGFNNLEIIFVDDCSTDNTYNMIREYTMNYPNVHAYKTDENSGSAGKPRNMGMKYATTDYVLFFDSDDVLYEDSCEILYDKIIETNASLVCGMQSFIHTDNAVFVPDGLYRSTFTDSTLKLNKKKEELDKFRQKYPEEIIIDDIREFPYVLGNFNMGSKLLSRKFIRDNQIDFPEYILAEDSLFLYKSLVSANRIVFIYKNIFKYDKTRVNEEDHSVTYDSNIDLQITRLEAYNEIISYAKEKNMEEITVKQVLCEKMRYFFNEFVMNKNLSDYDLTRIFNKTRQLCELLIKYDACLNANLEKIYSKIANDEYDEALLLCK